MANCTIALHFLLLTKVACIWMYEFTKVTCQHIGSTGNAGDILVGSCTCILQLYFGSHADTGGFHRIHQHLKGWNTLLSFGREAEIMLYL